MGWKHLSALIQIIFPFPSWISIIWMFKWKADGNTAIEFPSTIGGHSYFTQISTFFETFCFCSYLFLLAPAYSLCFSGHFKLLFAICGKKCQRKLVLKLKVSIFVFPDFLKREGRSCLHFEASWLWRWNAQKYDLGRLVFSSSYSKLR